MALGARMVPFAGWEMPVQYASIIEEHRTVRSAVGLFDLSHMGEVLVAGPESLAFTRYAVVSDPGALEPGQAQYSMLCDADGGIIDDLIVYRTDDGLPDRLQRGQPGPCSTAWTRCAGEATSMRPWRIGPNAPR